MTNVEALANEIVKAATNPESEWDEAESHETEQDLARMFGLGPANETRQVWFSDYILVLGEIDDGSLIVGIAPQSRDYYGGPIRMEWSNGWQEKVDDEYIGLEEIAAWIVRAVDY